MAEKHNGTSTATETVGNSAAMGNTSKDIEPEKWKMVNASFARERYSNPSRWGFKILKTSSFRPAWMTSMFSKYWNPPPMNGDGPKTNGEAKKVDKTFIPKQQSTPMQDTSGGASQKQSEGAPGCDDQKNKSLGKLAATRQNPEQLSDEEIQELKTPPEGKIKVLWIGHASLLIQMEGVNIMTDPVFSDKAGPRNVVGYKRYRKPAVTVEKLKENNIKIDAVVISHNHYDHFDKQSVQDLNREYPTIKWFVPVDLGSDFGSLGCEDVVEAMWWDRKSLGPSGNVKFHFTPAKHWSGRNPTDWYTSLWGSWIIEGKTAKVFFAGDTGYQEELFEAIADKFKDITVAALPIGAYEPREMMKCQHINPEEAVKIHNILQAKTSIGIHWRTFQLSCEEIDQPAKDLEEARKAHGVEKEAFITLEKDLITTITCDENNLHRPD